MALVATLTYIALALLSPWAAYPELARYRIMVWLMSIIGFVTLVQVLFGRVTLWVPQIPILGAFVLLIVFSVAATNPGQTGDVFTQLMVPLAACAALIGNVDSLARIRRLSGVLVLVGAYLSVRVILAIGFGITLETYAILESVGGPDEAEIYRGRALSFLGDPNDLAQYLVACFPLAVLLWRRGHAAVNAVAVVIPLSLMSAGLYLTRSRGGLIGLAFLVTLAFSRISRFGAPLAGVGLVAGLVALGFSGGRDTSISGGTGGGRLELWGDVFQVALAHPFAGVGYGKIGSYLGAAAHNTYLECLAETGVPGLFLWLAAFSFTLFQLWQVRVDPQISEEAKRYCRLGLASLASAMVTSLFLSRTYALTLYIFLGLAVATFLVARREQAEPQPAFRFKWFIWNGVTLCLMIGAVFALVRLKWVLASLG